MSEPQQDQGAVVITGSSTGIGRAAALLLDRSGYRVFAGVRRPADAERLRSEGSERLRPLLLDIVDQKQVDEAAVVVAQELGPEQGLRGLVDNAGICEPGPIEFISLERVRHQIETNFVGHVAVIQAFLPLIRKGHGRIINVGSAMGEVPFPLLGAYAASKSALEAMNDSLRRELSWWGIPVSLVIPGTVESPLWDKTPDSPDGLPHGGIKDKDGLYDEMAGAVRALMQQGRRVAVQPEVLARVIKAALEARRPKARYRCGPGSRMADLGRRLPQTFTDWVIDRVLKRKLPRKLVGW
jgi:NAD(P)-dependent dehydrogenase (short-subunit alcohol dehydrogenase family)